MSNIVNRGCSIEYTASGNGTPLLLVAGLTQWADQWVDAGYVGALQSNYRVIRVDTLGHGRSDKPHEPEPYRHADLIQDLVTVLDAEGVDTALCWGFSLGAAYVFDFAAVHPERVRGVVLGDAMTGPFPFRGRVSHPHLVPVVGSNDGLVALWQEIGYTDPEQVAAALEMNDVEALSCLFEGVGDAPVPDSIEAPVLAYAGSGWDELTPDGEAILANTNAERHDLGDANHYAAFTRSAEVLAIVEPFLDRHAA